MLEIVHGIVLIRAQNRLCRRPLKKDPTRNRYFFFDFVIFSHEQLISRHRVLYSLRPGA
jgi:hypothetical protein